jgi:DNA-binding PadR family transcriptional regulator
MNSTSPYTEADMSSTGDKRRRTDLDLFVLALVAEGVTTPYQMMTAAGLSPGATIPVLRRLLESSLVVRAKPGPRGRTEHRITAAGRRKLDYGWTELIEVGPTGDVDADLRIALLAFFVGGDRRTAVEYLRDSAGRRRTSYKDSERTEEKSGECELASSYRRLRAAFTASVGRAEAAGISDMAKGLPVNKGSARRSKRVAVLSQKVP